MSEKQRTIKKPVSVTGKGLHTGILATVTFKPAPVNHWYKFQRIDLPGQPIIDADADNVTDTERGTTLQQNGGKIATTEHLLAALVGLEIDNVLIEVNGPEIPIMDGSSLPFVIALEDAGVEEQDADRVYFELKDILSYEDSAKHIEMLAVPQETFRLTVMVDYNSPVLGTQHATIYSTKEFKQEIASCRTFVFLHELELLLSHNLIKGGDIDNAVVLVDRELPQEKLDYLAKVFNKPKVKVVEQGILNNTKLKFFNEPARHKLLDMVGDLALVGMPLKAHILAARPGHSGNVAFAKKLKEVIKKDKKGVPRFNVNAEPLLNVNDIMKLLPHRPPFLFVDKILELGENYVVGLKNVTMNEDFFRGHFPGSPIMPGVLQIEAMAQTGGILALKSVPDPENYLTYFMKIDNVRFRNQVLPGDTLVFHLELMSPVRRGIFHMKGTAYVGDKIATEAEMMAQIVKVKETNGAAVESKEKIKQLVK
ncbi:MAG TPA: bifunctional UDP-3-O-[3-hydroxymyristoyl] N-acetylglucosamine deacetylase/3-hydroxyacyl-ACP dehydratase [Bacteroidia bacterium]|jgi:UDP-3-O-[3-hydroxymyristoyl] N-acetylglucosamine deacetylase/3-hydroxyacyl-[acyl-carrier-protein] dehydratase|nr:bifunctional UDP-3-O-[3-hydroxymyristoyl] N-acetylglucosamine deacetylase/3-hydroxyacyl-ACP dehydratase [Bacteroidia bacterium]